ncbi:MAG TPA: D-glycerate dehydrogenase [Acidisphaera sp.]|nr:D-glycerate dehydrogenase [Acidisphaera sp.]
MKPRVVVACRVTDAVVARARTAFDAVVAAAADMTADEAIEATTKHQAEGLVFTSSLKLNADEIGRLPPALRVAATSSVGFDHIDVAAAQTRGLVVTNTPDVLTNATADLSFFLVLAACRRAAEYLTIMREGWRRRFAQHEMLGIEVTGKRLGIIGMGRIGRAVAQRARGFEMEVHYTNLSRLPPELEKGAIHHPTIEDMLPNVDIVTLHAPGGAANDKMMNRARIGMLPRGAVLVNAARGTLVDEDALIEALQSGQLAAAGLDVFRSEPDFDLRLRDLPNVFLTPHMGSATLETRNAMGNRALDNVEAVLSGRPPIDPLWR